MAQHAHLPVQLPWQASEYPHGSQPPGAVYSRACPPMARDITARYGVRLRTIGPDTGRVRVISGGVVAALGHGTCVRRRRGLAPNGQLDAARRAAAPGRERHAKTDDPRDVRARPRSAIDAHCLPVVRLDYPAVSPPIRLRESPAMTVALTLWTAVVLIILGSLVLSTVLQVRGQRVGMKHQAEVRRMLDEQKVETAANRERLERRTQELRETQHESLELKRKEIALREEQAASLRQLAAAHEQLLGALRQQRG